MIKKKASLITA